MNGQHRIQPVSLSASGARGDTLLELAFPAGWEVREVGMPPVEPLRAEEIRASLQAPIGTPPLRSLAAGKKRVGLVVDDLTRPTPAAQILPHVVEELVAAGVASAAISILVSTGSHAAPPQDALRMRLGDVCEAVGRVVVHDCHAPCVHLGKTKRGTPVFVNREVMEADLLIGVGSVYPHPAAGFSGGAKIAVPGLCGIETILYLHDALTPSSRRGGPLDNELRREFVEIARLMGLAFVVNVVLTDRRAVAGCFAGDPVLAHAKGVAMARSLGSIDMQEEVDVVIADAFPFDTTLQFAHDRALWPLLRAPRGAALVLVASCIGGVGTHELFPAATPLLLRIQRRIRHARPGDVRRAPAILRNAAALLRERRKAVLVFSESLASEAVIPVFPHGRVFGQWNDLVSFMGETRRKRMIRAAVYRAAPLLLPSDAAEQRRAKEEP